MLEAFTNTKIAPTSFFGSSPLGDEIKHSNPKQPEQEMGTLPQLQDSNKLGIVHTDHSRGEPRELYYDVVQPAGNAKIKVLSWVESPTANIDLHHSSKNIIEEVLKHGLLKRLHAITQQESNEVSPPFSLTIAPLAANVDQGYADKSLILSEISKRLDDIAQREYDWDADKSLILSEISKRLDDIAQREYD